MDQNAFIFKITVNKMASFAMPQTERGIFVNDLLQSIFLISSAPVEFTGATYYLPLIAEEDLTSSNETVVSWKIIEGITKSFLTMTGNASLKNISGLSGKLLQPYLPEHS